MSAPSFILFPGETAWRVAHARGSDVTFSNIDIADGAEPAQIARQVADALHQANYAGSPTVLAIPTTWCFSAAIATEDLPKSDHMAMLYRLEEKLPLAAESLIADFIQRPQRDGALGVCVRVDAVQPLVAALEASGVAVQSISPAVLLAVQGIAGLEESAGGVLLCGDGKEQVNLLVFDGITPVSWAVLPATVADLKLQLDLIALQQDTPHVESCDVDEAMIEALAEATSLAITDRETSASVAAARFGAQIAAGDERPLIEFRRGPLASNDRLVLHRRSLNHVLAATVALMLVLGAVLFVRAAEYANIRQASEQKMTEAFEQKFPGLAIPPNVKRRLDSEAASARVQTGSGMPEEAGRSALKTLNELLKNLPADAHFEISDVNIEEPEFTIRGRLRSYEDVDLITSAIRKAGLTVTLPEAKRDSDNYWSFTVHGSRPAKAS